MKRGATDPRLEAMVREDLAEMRREGDARGGGCYTLHFSAHDLHQLGWLVRVVMPRPALRNWLLSETFKVRFKPHFVKVKERAVRNPSVELALPPGTLFSFIEAAQAVLKEDDERIRRELAR